MSVAGRRRLVAQPGGLTLGFALHLVGLTVLRYNSIMVLLTNPRHRGQIHRVQFQARSWG